jgi:hypothetical protein
MDNFTSYSSNELRALQKILEAMKEQNKLLQEQIVLLNDIKTNTAP